MIKTQKWLHGEKKTKQELRLKDIQDILESEQFGKTTFLVLMFTILTIL